MTFDRPFVLLFLLFIAVWGIYEWRRTLRRRALAVKIATFALIVLALSQPSITVPETRSAVAMLVDTSSSIPSADLASASRYAHEAQRARGRNWIRVIPFAAHTRPLEETERRGRDWSLHNTAGDAGHGTDIEAAVREAVASLPGDAVPRIALLSDGRENRGSLVRAAWLARELRIPIDAVALPGQPAPTLRLESVSVPTLAFTGERFPIDISLNAPRSTSGSVELTADGKVIGTSPIRIEPGSTQFRVHTNLNVAGAVEISARIRAAGLGEVSFERAMTLRRPRILYVSSDPPGTESHLLDTLRAGQFDVQPAADLLHSNLAAYQLIVLNNQDLEHIPAARKTILEQYVRGGGGLLIIGGERNVYVEKKTEDALDRVLPAKLAPPRSQEGTCVVLIIDKSSSMEGRKMDLARLSAIGVIDNLKPVDQIGVLIFDNSFQWAVPIRRAEDRTTIKRLVSGIMPDGGTQIAPALAEAYRKIVGVNATYKHIVLLTDGISEEGDSMALSREAAQQRVTISTVGLGQDVNRAYLEKVAVNAKGNSYFLVDPSGLEQLLVKDVMEHTGSTAIEKAVYANAGKKTSSVLEGVPVEGAPPLHGYVRFLSKPGAETALHLTGSDDPLYVSWQFGLGRAAVWTSDAKSRWAERWVTWNGFDRLWLNIFRDLLPQAASGEANAHFDETSGDLVVEYRLAPNAPAPAKVPQIYVLGPSGFRKPVPVRKTAEGVYRGQLRIGNMQGLFRIRPLEDSREFPETGFYREQDELADYGNDEAVLRHVADFTGGRFAPSPAALFDTGGRSLWKSMSLWPALLAFAIALNLIELIMRKWSGLSGLWSRRRAS